MPAPSPGGFIVPYRFVPILLALDGGQTAAQVKAMFAEPEATVSKADGIEMLGVRDYGEGLGVELAETDGRLVVRAFNQCGYDNTTVDLLDLIAWLRDNRPDLLQQTEATRS